MTEKYDKEKFLNEYKIVAKSMDKKKKDAKKIKLEKM